MVQNIYPFYEIFERKKSCCLPMHIIIFNTKTSNKDFKTLDGKLVFCVPIWQVVGVILDSCGGVGMAWASLRQVELLQVLYFTLYLVYSVYMILFSTLNIVQVLEKWKSCKYNSSLYITHDIIYSISSTLFRTTLV